MTTTKINSTHYQIYPPTEFYKNWELHFWDGSKKHLVKIKIDDISKFMEDLTVKSKELRTNTK